MHECPDCGKTDSGKELYACENCGTLFDYDDNYWECEYCHDGENSEMSEEVEYCPDCGEELVDDSYCYNCGWPNNRGWIGENVFLSVAPLRRSIPVFIT